MTKPRIFVFGSNLEGWHSKGAALCAFKEHGAIRYQGVGLQGRSYAIPTRFAISKRPPILKTLDLRTIASYVTGFILLAQLATDLDFDVTRIGCGHAGYTDAQMAPLFKGAPSFNVKLPKEWEPYV